MSYIRKKAINGKLYNYLVKSVKMPDGQTKKIMKLLGSKEKNLSLRKLESKYKDYFIEKEAEFNTKYSIKNFIKNNVFSEEEIGKLERIKVEYKQLIRKLNKARLKDIFDRFVVNFTYNSNAIEGNSLTLKDVRIVIYENSVVKGKELREIYETRNSRKVMDMVLSKKFDVSSKGIIKMHKVLMKDIDVRTGYKKIPNVILSAGREIKTTPPEKVEKEMNFLIDLYNENKGKMHPLELASIFHGRFEKIHPFEDGNGRVGRFLINIILVKNHYPPLIVRTTVRKAYMSCLQAFDNGHEDKLKRFLVEKYKETFRKFFEIYVKYV